MYVSIESVLETSQDTERTPVLILAIETSTASGSLALARDGQLLEVSSGDPSRTHGERLPSEAQVLLQRHGFTYKAVDCYAVALGPGSFTGLRVGIATTQGLALAHERQVIGISVIDTLVHIAAKMVTDTCLPELIIPWIDGKRGEVFSAVYDRRPSADTPHTDWEVLTESIAAPPEVVLDRWVTQLRKRVAWFIGDGVPLYKSVIEAKLGPRPKTISDIPPLAGEMAVMASSNRWLRQAMAPHAIRPVYIRRPDAELARNRRRNANA